MSEIKPVETQYETIEIEHPVHGGIQFEAPIGMSDEQIRIEFQRLDLDLLLGLDTEKDIGETNVEKIKEFENSSGAGLKENKWYGHDSLEGGTQTIAYGHKLTPTEEKEGIITIGGEQVDYRQGLSQDQAEALLKQDASWAETVAIASLKKVGLDGDEGKVQALTSLIYNVGSGAWGDSNAKAYLESGNIEDFMHEAFSEEEGFVKVNGKTLRGLVRRRAAEAQLFASANIDEGGGFAEMIQDALAAINPISSAAAAEVTPQTPLDSKPTTEMTQLPTLKRNAKDTESVGTLQDMLGMDVGEDRGIFGPATEKAVKAFQKKQGLTADGIVGKNTWAALQGFKPKVESTPDLSIKKKDVPKFKKENAADFFGKSLIPAYGSHAQVAAKHMAASMFEKIGLPVPETLKETITEDSLSPDVLNVVRIAAYNAKKEGRFTNYKKDYGDAAKLVYGNLRQKLGTIGTLQEMAESFFDPEVAAAMTIGESSNIVERNGILYLVADQYNFPTISKTKGDAWLGLQSLFGDQDGMFSVSPENQQKIEINLGPISEIEKLLNDQEDNNTNQKD
jgi:GH24 family phage-related lysozyme (muramidase)